MAKYSYELKKEIVQAYLNKEGGYKYLSKKYGVPSKSCIEKWVHNYEVWGDDGLMRSRKQQTFSFEFKLSVVELYLTAPYYEGGIEKSAILLYSISII